jgi:AraC-like DNA-binding protein
MKPLFEKIHKPEDQSFYLEEVIKPYFPDLWHYHPEIEILYIREGYGTKYVGDSINAFCQGDLVIVGSEVPHVWSCDPDYLNPESKLMSSAVCIQFMESFMGISLTDIPELSRINKFLLDAKRGIQFVNRTRSILIKQIEGLLYLTGMKRLICLLTILETMSTSKDIKYLSSKDKMPLILNSDDKERMETIFRYVIKNYQNEILLDQVASLVCLTPQSFCRYFKSRTGKVFSSFINEVRIGNACRMIIEKKESVSQVCYASGFNYLSNFNRQFKKIKGMTPSEFQRKYENQYFNVMFDN